jgi:2-C-methyl-D-erythritol 4-phosphate cytidylyltransferase
MTFWVVVPAAGVGRRFGAGMPKQYCHVAGKPIIEHTLARLVELEPEGIVVAIAGNDRHWPTLPIADHPLISTVEGGEERAQSVLNALTFLEQKADAEDWVLVHDVARPCVRRRDVKNLLQQLASDPVGGLLAVPTSDTLKQVDGHCISHTVDRAGLWSAMTPQMFRHAMLLKALQQQVAVTDESMAMELAGYTPNVVEGSRDNIKVTRPEDLAIVEAILRWQSSEELE